MSGFQDDILDLWNGINTYEGSFVFDWGSFWHMSAMHFSVIIIMNMTFQWKTNDDIPYDAKTINIKYGADLEH